MNATMKLQQAHDALARRDWAQANVLLRALDDLDADDTMALATTAYLVGDVDAAVRVWQAAYAERVQADDRLGAVRVAFWLGLVFSLRGEYAVAGGWVARAQRLLAADPDDIVERGYLLIHEFYAHLGRGDFGRAAETAGQRGRGRATLRRSGSDRPGSDESGSDADLLRPGQRRTGAPGRGDGRHRHRRGVAGLRRDGLLLVDRGLPGVVGLRPGCVLDAGARHLVRRSARTGSLHRPVLRAQGSGAASARRMGGGAGGVCDRRASVRGQQPTQRRGRNGLRRARGCAPDPRRVRPRGGGVRPGRGAGPGAAARPDSPVAGPWPDDAGRCRRCAGCWPKRTIRWPAPRCCRPRSRCWSAADSWTRPGRPPRSCRRSPRRSTRPPCRPWRPTLPRACPWRPASPSSPGAGARILPPVARTSTARTRSRERGCWSGGTPRVGRRGVGGAELTAARQAFVALGAKPAVDEVDRLLDPRRPGGMTEREVEVLRLVAEGRSNADIADGSLPEPEDRGSAPEQHLHQARRLLPDRGGRVRAPARTDHVDLTRAQSQRRSGSSFCSSCSRAGTTRSSDVGYEADSLARAAFKVADGVITLVANSSSGR